jgi:hypothetical protein
VAWCEALFHTKPQSHRALRGTTKQSECLETASISKWRITGIFFNLLKLFSLGCKIAGGIFKKNWSEKQISVIM